MDTVRHIPDVKGKSVCEKHGEYEHRYTEIWGGKFLENAFCPKCAEEIERQRAEDEAKEERERVEALTIKTRINSGVSKRNIDCTFDNFEAGTDKQVATKERVVRWLGEFKEDKSTCPSMIITGGVGTGKTLLASCIINELAVPFYCGGKLNVKMIKIIDLVRILKESWRRDSEYTERDVIEKYTSLDLLIIDEVGMGFESDTEKLFVFDIIDGRYQNMLPTILISNLNMDGIKKSIGDRAVDRLREGGGFQIGCDWESYRK